MKQINILEGQIIEIKLQHKRTTKMSDNASVIFSVQTKDGVEIHDHVDYRERDDGEPLEYWAVCMFESSGYSDYGSDDESDDENADERQRFFTDLNVTGEVNGIGFDTTNPNEWVGMSGMPPLHEDCWGVVNNYKKVVQRMLAELKARFSPDPRFHVKLRKNVVEYKDEVPRS